MKFKCLIFSKDRATQLLALLESLEFMCEDFSELSVTVLYKTSSTQHEEQYSTLKSLYANIDFRQESNFEKDVGCILSNAEYILFLVDDCIFINSFRILDVVDTLAKHPDSIGFSLRLGRNISYCYPFDCIQKQPTFNEVDRKMLKYNWLLSEYDFGYPMDVSSSIYRVKDILLLLSETKFNTVNALEGVLWAKCKIFKDTKQYLICFDTGCAFCNPLNVVSSIRTNKNRRSNKQEYKIDSLFEKFNQGYRIDVTKFFNLVPIGCHQESDLTWIKRDE